MLRAGERLFPRFNVLSQCCGNPGCMNTTRSPISLSLVALGLVCLALAAAGCGGGSDANRPAAVPSRFSDAGFDPQNFLAPANAANRWLPLKPGTQWVRVGGTDVGHRRVPHRVISTVTNVSKLIAGVRTVAVLDQDVDAGQTTQESLDYYGTDKRGAVWYLGSYTEQYEGGRFVTIQDAWLGGVKGAKPGILMPGAPNVRTKPWTIAQPPGADPDAAQVVKTGQRHQCVPFKCFDDVLVIREGKASALDNEFKYYAPGVGQILNTPKSKSMHHDVESLVNVTQVSPRGLKEVSAEVLKLDRHARHTKPGVYGGSQPAKAVL